jgi:hypothetical protein
MKTFTQILADLNGGEADELITDRLAEVVQAVEEYRGNGKLTVQASDPGVRWRQALRDLRSAAAAHQGRAPGVHVPAAEGR